MSSSLINLVVALPAEAKPVASWFNLKRLQPEQGFAIYRQQHISLVVSGPGKVNAAAATAYLCATTGRPTDAIWVNLGIAGHGEREVSEILLAHKLADEGSGRCWYPPLAARLPCATDTLTTLERPDLAYERTGMLDMEASGFYPTACRFSTGELVQVLKVISDNRRETADQVNAKLVHQLVGESLDVLDALLARLGALANELHEIQVPEEILQHYRHHWSFTATQHHQLTELLARWQTLAHTDMLWQPELRRLQSPRDLLQALRAHVDGLPIRL